MCVLLRLRAVRISAHRKAQHGTQVSSVTGMTEPATALRSWKAGAEALLRRAARQSITRFERVTHPLRRSTAHARLRELRLPTRMLFICEGNIYRSPFAAGCLMRMLPERIRSELFIGSAGFTGPGRSSPADAIELAARYEVDLTAHRSSLVHAAMLSEWDVFVVMNSRQARHLAGRFSIAASRIFLLGDLDLQPINRRAIADPWGDPANVLEPCYARVLRCAETMAEVLTASWDARSDLLSAPDHDGRVRANR